MSNCLIIGITGGIGSGKSVISRLLCSMGYAVYNSDDEAKMLLDNSPSLQKKLAETFGTDIFDNGKFDKEAFASIIFSNEKQLQKANAIIHPEVIKHFSQWLSNPQIHKSTNPQKPIFIETAILFESGFDKLVDKTILVYAPRELRLERAVKRAGEEQRFSVEQRMAQQISDEEKIKMVDFVVVNDETQAVIPQVEKILQSLL